MPEFYWSDCWPVTVQILQLQNHLGLEKTSRTIKSNLSLITSSSTRPCHEVPHVVVSWTPPGRETPATSWTVHTNAQQAFLKWNSSWCSTWNSPSRKFEAIFSCPVTCCLGEEADLHLWRVKTITSDWEYCFCRRIPELALRLQNTLRTPHAVGELQFILL